MASFPKTPIVRSEAYRRYVASQDCFGCGSPGRSQCAHANEGKGLGMKVSDLNSFPLCGPIGLRMGCHAELDMSVEMTREERRALEREYVARMQAMAARDGWVDGKQLRKAA